MIKKVNVNIEPCCAKVSPSTHMVSNLDHNTTKRDENGAEEFTEISVVLAQLTGCNWTTTEKL